MYSIENLINLTSNLNIISSKQSLTEIDNLLLNLENELRDFSIKIVFVGSFNAGKTSLINTLLDEDRFKENIRPETAIATEITYSQEPFAQLTHKDGETIKCQVHEVDKYDITQYYKYKFFLNNDRLSNFENLIIVDMPGFDSGVEAHNKAMMQYINEASIYVLVLDVEKGTLSQSTVNFLQEISSYSNNIILILNKCDKQTSENISKVMDNSSQMIANITGYQPPAFSTSKYNCDTLELLSDAVNQFDKDMLVNQRFVAKILYHARTMKTALLTKKSSIICDTHELDRKIHDANLEKDKIVQILQNEKIKLHQTLQNQVKAQVLSDARTALMSNASSLATSAKAGNDSFSNAVNSILRPVFLNSMERHIEMSFNTIISNIQVSYLDASYINDIVNNVMEGLSKLQQTPVSGEKNLLYKGILGILGITTSVVAPWLEVLILFVPDIINFFVGMFNSNQDEEFIAKIKGEIIPNIISKIEPELSHSLQQTENEMIQVIEDEFNKQIQTNITVLEDLKQQKEQQTQNIESLRNELEDDLSAIENIITQLEQLI
ncbi:MAG: hypothetical protein ATN36_06470 [Epulopiscium sp. Nele67-Bin005]|nr:MAG: hypothetical protein ATN36_06470 [Epulopiscium sp. Nele67-Bin005]